MGVRTLFVLCATLVAGALIIPRALQKPYAQAELRMFRTAKAAAERGNLQAQYDLALCYGGGRGVAKDEAEAMKWIRKAAGSGEPRSQDVLGSYYANGGKSAPADDVQAAKLFRQSADQGWAEGQLHLGLCYMEGRGIAKDDKLALEWIRRAAEQGHALAQYHVAFMLLNGRGTSTNDTEAVQWLQRAAEGGQGSAQFNLGMAFAMGKGTNLDLIQAHKWVSIALLQGKGDNRALPALAQRMTPDMIEQAERLAKDFKPRSARPSIGNTAN